MSVDALAPDVRVPPAFLAVPEHVSSAGPEVVDLAASVGMDLDGEQALALDAMYAERPDGRVAALEFALICARQNLKTFTFQAAALADLFLFDERLVIWTAHLFPTTQEAFRDIHATVENYDHLRRRVHKVSTANGEEGIELLTGCRLLFKARSKTGGRGLSGDKIFLDEAFALDATVMGALFPTLSARPNPQVRYGSSAGMESSAVLRGLRNRGRAGGDPSLGYVEWADPVRGGCELGDDCGHDYGVPGCALDDMERVRRANPALGRRITVQYLEGERRALPPAEYARERLGWWEDPVGADSDLTPELWASRSVPGAVLVDPVVIVVDASPGLRSAAVVACGADEDGVPTVEVVRHARGAAWVPQFLADVKEKNKPLAFGLDPGAPVGALIPDIDRAGVEYELIDARDSAQACGGFVAAVVEGEVQHRNEGPLNSAVTGAARRHSGDTWRWSRRDSRADISPLVAATYARHLYGVMVGDDVDVLQTIW